MSEAIRGYLLFKSLHASEATIETDVVLLRQFTRWLDGDPDVTDIDADAVRGYLDYQKARGLSPFTVQRHHAAISALFAWLASDDIGLASDNPARAVRLPRPRQQKIRYLSRDEITRLVAATERVRCKRRAKALVLFLLDSAARASEVAGVQLSDVDFKAGRVKVLGKRDRERFVYVGRRALSSLWLYVTAERPEPARVTDDHLFLTRDGYPMNRDSILQAIKRLSRLAGVEANVHVFRHTAAVEHLRNGMDVFTLQMLLGHSDLSMTRKYLTALGDEDVEQQARRTSPADNWRL